MTYLQLLLFAFLPPLVILAPAVRRDRVRLGPGAFRALVVVAGATLAYTAPLEALLIRRGVRGYAADRVLVTLGGLPVEACILFLLQALLTGIVYYRFRARLGEEAPPPGPASPRRVRFLGAIPWVVAAGNGALLVASERGRHLGLVLVWSMPALTVLWLGAGPRVWRWRAAVLPGVLIPTLWLWVAHRVAGDAGIRTSAGRYGLGWAPFGLPLEEPLFVLAVHLMVVFALVALVERRSPTSPPPPAPPGSAPAARSGPGPVP